jgi:serine/threonine protein phosphatase PrpC
MQNSDLHPYCGKASRPGMGKQISQDRTRVLTRDINLVQKAGRGELFALFDGMGSKGQGGADAAEKMCDSVVDFFRKPDQIPATIESMSKLLMQGNMAIHEWASDTLTGRTRGGCVGTVFWVYEETIHVFHVGDTAAFQVDSEKATRLTSRHCDRQGLITSFFGMGPALDPEVQTLELLECDYLVLLSDGIADACLADDIFKTTHSYEVQHAADELVRLALSRNARDDLTAMVIDVGEMVL